MKSAKLSIAVFIKWVFHSQHHCILVHSRKSKCLWLWSLSTALTCSSALFHFSALCWNWVFPISLYPALSSSVMDFHFSANMSLISFIELFGLPRSSFGYSSFGETTYPYAGRLRSCLGTPFSWFSWSCAYENFVRTWKLQGTFSYHSQGKYKLLSLSTNSSYNFYALLSRQVWDLWKVLTRGYCLEIIPNSQDYQRKKCVIIRRRISFQILRAKGLAKIENIYICI